ELVAGIDSHRLAEHLGAGLGDQRGGSRGGGAVLARPPKLAEIGPAEADHRAGSGPAAAPATRRGRVRAPAEKGASAAHAPLRLRGIGKPAERPRLGLGRSRAAGIGEAALVLGPAAVDLAEREVDVAAQMMEPRELGDDIVPLAFLLRCIDEG